MRIRPWKLQSLSIFTRLAFAFTAVTTVVCGLLFVATYSFYNSAITKRTHESLVQQLTITHDRFVQEYGVNLTRTLRALASSVVLDDYLLSSQVERLVTGNKVQRVFQQTLHEVASCRSISFADLFGKLNIRATALPPTPGTRAGHGSVEASQSAVATATSRLVRQLTEQPPGTLHIEGPFLDGQSQVGFVAGLSKLDLDTGELAGVLVIQHRLTEFFETLTQLRIMGANPVWVLAPSGRLLHQPSDTSTPFDPRPHLLPADQFEPRVMTVDGGLVAYQDYALLPNQPLLRIAVSLPKALLLRDLQPALHFFVLVFSAALCVVLILALTLSRYLAKPIRELATAATRVAQGEADVQVAAQSGGEVQQLVVSFNQMTDKLQQTTVSRDALAQEVVERQRAEAALHEAKGAAEAANQAKSEFLANMSHELRTPLHGILSFADLGIEKASHAPTERVLNYFHKISQSGQTLLSLLNDLLDLAKLEAGKMTFAFEPRRLDRLLTQVVEEFESLLAERRLSLQLDLADVTTAIDLDAERIVQVLRNLMSNAVKFSPEGSTIWCRLHDRADHVGVSVQDQGIGIPADEVVTIFDKFTQSSKTHTGAGGTGLGLAICREIVEAHQGCIWAENVPEGGAVFWLELPKQGLYPQRVDELESAETSDTLVKLSTDTG